MTQFTITCSDANADKVAAYLWAMPSTLGIDATVTAARTPSLITTTDDGTAVVYDENGDVMGLGRARGTS